MTNEEIFTIEGFIKKINPKPKNYFVNVNEVWTAGFGKPTVKQGDYVKIEYVVNGEFKNIKKIETIEAPKNIESDSAGSVTSKFAPAVTILSYIKDAYIARLQVQSEDARIQPREPSKIWEEETDNAIASYKKLLKELK